MGLEIIGPSFGRTGTGSLKIALEHIGFGPCHHSFGQSWQVPMWQAALAGEAIDWDKLFTGYRSQLDWPGAHYWRELAAAYPNAKVILLVRPEDEWWKSFSETIAIVLATYQSMSLPPHIHAIVEMGAEIVGPRTFGAPVTDRQAGIAAYRRRMEEVQAEIPPERLLMFNIRDGWEPLCQFLGRPVPDKPFPRKNATEDWWVNWPRGFRPTTSVAEIT